MSLTLSYVARFHEHSCELDSVSSLLTSVFWLLQLCCTDLALFIKTLVVSFDILQDFFVCWLHSLPQTMFS